jgi:hypothetical protein
LALLSLNSICDKIPRIRQQIPRDAVEQAEAIGIANHAALAQASREFLQACG